MATRRKKPDATDTEPPEEARPDTTATPLLVEDGKLLPPEAVFTAEKLLRWLHVEGLADKHKKDKMHANAWSYVQACMEQDVTKSSIDGKRYLTLEILRLCVKRVYV